MMETIFFRSDRQDATLQFASPRPPSVIQSVGDFPVSFRSRRTSRCRHADHQWPVLAEAGHRGTSSGRRPQPNSRSRPPAGRLPETGLALGDRVADILDVRPGDLVEVEILGGTGRTVAVPVTAIIQSYLGMIVFMNIDALGRLRLERATRIERAISCSTPHGWTTSTRAVKHVPEVAGVALLTISPRAFQGDHADQHEYAAGHLPGAQRDHRLRRGLQRAPASSSPSGLASLPPCACSASTGTRFSTSYWSSSARSLPRRSPLAGCSASCLGSSSPRASPATSSAFPS